MVRDEEVFEHRSNHDQFNIRQFLKKFIGTRARFSPAGTLAITIAGIVTAEVIAMLIVYFVNHLPYILQVVLDAAVMAVIITPLLYFLSLKPLLMQIQLRRQSERILQTRLRLKDYADEHTLSELFQFALDEFEALTGSAISFVHFLEADQTIIKLQAWSTNTLKNMCTAEGANSHYDIGRAGVWADAARERRTIIHNNYPALPNRKGMPEGHAQVAREMVVPVLRDKKVVAILGVGNKPQDYTANDAEVVSTLADFLWDIVNNKQAGEALRESEVKFRTFADWTYDWELWIGSDRNVVYTSPSCERITGYRPEEFTAQPDLVLNIVHPDDRHVIEAHERLIHDPKAGSERVDFRILARDGSEHWVEHICRPLFAPDGHYLGRRISNREITERKQAEKKIREQANKEAVLTKTIQNIQADIARDLHDMLGQNIGFLSMNLGYMSETVLSDPIRVKTQIQQMTGVANESYELVRAMLSILTFSDATDPLKLFIHYAEQVAGRSGMRIEVASHGESVQLAPNQVRQLFYIFREALRNTEKYASAGQVSGDFFWEENSLTMEICDNGCGFDSNTVQAAGHYGIKFMRERAMLAKGTFSLQSEPGQGTIIRVVVPYE